MNARTDTRTPNEVTGEVLLLAKVLLLSTENKEITLSAAQMSGYIEQIDRQALNLKQDFNTEDMTARFYLEAYAADKDNKENML